MSEKRIMLETPRLILRPWKKNKADAKELYRYAKDPKIGPAAGWKVHKDAAESLQIIRDILSTPDIYAVVLKETGKPIGAAGLTYGSTGRKYLKRDEAEIGYWIGAEHWGKGYAPEAVQVLLERGFTQLGCSAIWCGYFEGNEKSRRVQEKCGFRYHHTEAEEIIEALGEKRREHFSRITKEEWKQRNRQAGS